MDVNGLDLNLLVLLDILFEERNVTRAAKRIHLSQSATSAALARLRKFFDDDLLAQVGKKMVLTPRAEGLIHPVREFLLQAQAITGYTGDFDPGTSSRHFRLMMSDYAATILLPELIPRMERLAPGVTVEILTQLDAPGKMLDHGDIDLLIFPREAIESTRHPSENLFQEDYVCIVWSGNRLVSDWISLDQYLSLGHVGLRPGAQSALTMDFVVLEERGYHRRIEILGTDFNMVPELVVGTNRIATVHRRLAKKHSTHLPIRLLEPPVTIPSFTEAVHWHKNRDRDLGIRWMRNLILEVANAVN
jgi:LysR family nod box-dependent transcriptional activator